jgi:arylsulfatase A-like enzyme
VLGTSIGRSREPWSTVPPAAFVAAVALLLCAGGCEGRGDERPGIVLLLIDTLRADHLGAYGFDAEISPRLDELAAESIVFENCYAQAPWTPPSMGSLFTSLAPEVHGLHRFTDHQFLDPDSARLRASVLPGDAVTLAEGLRDAGYRTAGFVANPWLHRNWGLAQGFELYRDGRLGKPIPALALTTDARAWVEEHPPGEPFFLYLHFMEVHGPYLAPRADFAALWKELESETPRVLRDDQTPKDHLDVHPSWADESLHNRLDYWKARYAAGVRLFDRRIGSFLDFLEESGVLDRSYLIVTSDHGEELFEHGGWGHGKTLRDHQLLVPLIVRPPGGVEGGRRIRDPVRLVDLMPTLLSLADATPPAGMQGVDLSPLLHGAEVASPPVFFSTGVLGHPDMFAVRKGRYKLIVEGGATELFDVVADPGETTDLSGRDPTIEDELRELLAEHLEPSSAATRLPARSADIPDELRERLRALGYLE